MALWRPVSSLLGYIFSHFAIYYSQLSRYSLANGRFQKINFNTYDHNDETFSWGRNRF